MPATKADAWTIACDNPACPGHPELDAGDRAGWLFVTAELYGDPTFQRVYGSLDCVAADTTSKAAAGETW